ncbi:head GIN domain-containing protein [Altibacter sp. HG106]|uniref:head GIN domain-containing protein n=1 Tax=Altibacter sp. HG106 TaxID=3023937 RepID=UPI002350865C|nr:head GIN domain-containing protein [Altibacter sp. HG106]MDC7993852.1 DUF2807 domain-containing protein [Altibacter sp. HG106]
MKTIQISLLALIALTLSSCNFDLSFGQVNGNGNVVTEERPVTSNFSIVRGSAGLDVYLSEGDENKIVIEADENLMEIIDTEIRNGKLHVTTNSNIGRSKSKKVYVTYQSLGAVEASSGADVIVNSVLEADEIRLKSSSGADLEAEVRAQTVWAETSSGADIVISGRAASLTADASSGSHIKARQLEVLRCDAEASSGANIVVNVQNEMKGEASSGGNIRYYGDPTAVSVRDGVSGNVSKM